MVLRNAILSRAQFADGGRAGRYSPADCYWDSDQEPRRAPARPGSGPGPGQATDISFCDLLDAEEGAVVIPAAARTPCSSQSRRVAGHPPV